jgi:hypothetical protein
MQTQMWYDYAKGPFVIDTLLDHMYVVGGPFQLFNYKNIIMLLNITREHLF